MPDLIPSRPTPWTTVILLCGKCARKMSAGYGSDGKDTLRTALKTELKARNRRRSVRVIETRCMGLCPKKAVAALDAGNPGRILAVRKGARTEDVLAELVGPERDRVPGRGVGRCS